MLPAIPSKKTFTRNALVATLALGLALPAAPAMALNEKERGIVAGALGVLLLQGLAKGAQAQNNGQSYTYSQPQTHYVAPLPSKPANVHKPRPVTQSVHRTPAAYAFSGYTPSERRAIQRSLARHGYYYGGIDGAFGPGTYRAVMDYARAIKSFSAMQTQAGAYGVYDRLLFAR